MKEFISLTKPVRRRYGWQVTAIVNDARTYILHGWSDRSAKAAIQDVERKILNLP